MPLLMLHDIGWPLSPAGGYYAPERIPAEHRQPLAFNTYLAPEEPGTLDEGMPFACVAAREGGPRTGSSPRSRTSSPPGRTRVREGAGVFRLRRHLAPRRALGGGGRHRGRSLGPQPGARAARGQPGSPHGRALQDDPPGSRSPWIASRRPTRCSGRSRVRARFALAEELSRLTGAAGRPSPASRFAGP